MNNLTLENIVVKGNRVDYNFSVTGNLQKYFMKHKKLFFEYNFDLSDIPESILAIPFLSNVAPLIWITDSTVLVDQLDYSFYECLEKVRSAYQRMFPNIKFKGNIVVNKIVNNQYTPKQEAACLFSGGLDALATYLRNKEKKPLLITEYAWHNEEIEISDVWEADKKNAINFAEQYQLENILIQSNYGTFIRADKVDLDFYRKLGDSWWHGLHHGLAIISAAIPIAFKLKIECIYIASSNSPLLKVTCASDPSVDNEIRYASGKVFHDAFELTRQDKVKVVTDYYSNINEKVNIRVCFKNEENCCNCEKCLRTILAIVAEGKNPNDYGFNIEGNISNHLKAFLSEEVKFFTDTFIEIYWKIIQKRMGINFKNILYKDLLDWFLDYDFYLERKKGLLKYRITKFFPIIIRKLKNKINTALVSD
jgi:hypothetical protein